MQSEMDVLVLENFLMLKEEQPVGFRPRVEIGTTTAPGDSPWADPKTGDPLVVTRDAAINSKTGARYVVEEDIPRLFVPTDDADLDKADVKQFYKTTPSPGYESGADNVRALLEKSRHGMYARLLNEQIPFDARVVEIGCGTGQLTNFLAIAHRSTLGTDVCLNSLRLGRNFAQTHGIEHAAFAQMNLFRPGLKDGFFDYVISNNVLPHTNDPRGAFARISRLAKPGGYVLVGLYNKFSRWLSSGRQPQEISHGMDEVFGWLRENNLEFVNAIPKPTPVTALEAGENLFEPKIQERAGAVFWSQVRAMPNGLRDGGSFIVIARRR
jgi:2-polyprenyl-3-methyl-5-hydroxy-6-metoxy-1,4-benzoquinol methylase